MASAAAAKIAPGHPKSDQLRTSGGQPQIGFMHEGRRLERLTGRLPRHAGSRQSAEFVVDQRQQFVGGLRVTSFQSGESA